MYVDFPAIPICRDEKMLTPIIALSDGVIGGLMGEKAAAKGHLRSALENVERNWPSYKHDLRRCRVRCSAR